MGTKLQSKSYFPGYCFMRDLNEDADSGSWPIYHENRMLMSRQYYNGFLPRSATDGHSECDKEVLRQTMLIHEATFKKQVAELHRVYRIQRNMMEELIRKEVPNYSEPVDASQSVYHSSSSQMLSEDARKMWDISGRPSCSRPSFSSTDNVEFSSELIKSSSMQVHTVPNGRLKDCSSLDSNSKKEVPRRMFDLHLPADQYIDNEEGEPVEGEKRLTLDNNGNLSLGSRGNLKGQGDSSISDLSLRNKQNLADLNHPIQCEEAASSASVSNFVGPVSYRNDTQVQDSFHQNPGSLVLPREFFHNIPRGMSNGTYNNGLHLKNIASRQQWPSFNLENGQTGSNLNSSSPHGVGLDGFATTSKPVQVEFRNTQLPQFLLDDQRKRGLWRENGSSETETSKTIERLAGQSLSRSVLAPDTPYTYPVVTDFAGPGPSSSFSSWKRPTSSVTQSATAVHELQCSSTSAQMSKISEMSIQKNGKHEAQWYLNGHSRSNTSSGNGVSYPNGFLSRSQNESNASESRLASVGFEYLNGSKDKASASMHFENPSTSKYLKRSEYIDVKSAKDLNLNIAIPNGFIDDMVPQQENMINNGERKNKDPIGGLPWLTRAACTDVSAKGRGGLKEKGFCVSQSHSHISTPKFGYENDLTPNSAQDSSTSIVCDAEYLKTPKSDSPSGSKILGFPIFDRNHINNGFSPLGCSSKVLRNLSEIGVIIPNDGRVGACSIDLTCNPLLLASPQKSSSEKVATPTSLNKDISRVKYHFNLNSCAEEEELPTYSTQGKTVRFEIDLEVPAVPETSDVTPPEEVSQADQLKAEESQDSSEELVKVAAEAIVVISASNFWYHPQSATCRSSESSPNDSLRWFADCVDGFSRQKKSCDSDSSSSESDYFETMTLNLTETKLEKCLCKPWAPEPPNEEECASSVLPTRRRRGQAKRGRQRRDFQRDILPGLTSLSRHEVTEDIQIIGGLIRATGQPWQSGVARRNAARNGWARGRRRTRNVAETIVCSPPRQHVNNNELGLEERSLTGWGKTTRRPRRQRLAAGNISIPITQV